MPVGSLGLPDSNALIDSGVAQRNTPEFPPEFKCRHCTTSSKFVTVVFVRITPTGLPVHLIRPFSHVHVSGSQFTLVKSSFVRSRQPSPVPSMNAFGSVSAAYTAPAKTQAATNIKTDFIP